MFVKSIDLNNFRNYNILSINLCENVNVIYGNNAQGKTNILEALYMCATTKSHRHAKDKDIIKIGQNEAHIRLFVQKSSICHKIDMHLKRNKSKGVAIDGIPTKKYAEFLGNINIVLFSPEDLCIIKGSPKERRHFLDMELCQISKTYMYNLSQYNKILLQRNNLLKQIRIKRELLDTLSIWDSQLVHYGIRIIDERKNFIKQMNEILFKVHMRLTKKAEEVQMIYEPNVTKELFEEKLFLEIQNDLNLKTTTVGPHRDDICFKIKDIDIRKFGSQGQQRTVALSIRLSEIDIVKDIVKDTPVLLLDDVLSELDRSRQDCLLESISGIQTIITCTGVNEFINNNLNINKFYKVKNGTVEISKTFKEE